MPTVTKLNITTTDDGILLEAEKIHEDNHVQTFTVFFNKEMVAKEDDSRVTMLEDIAKLVMLNQLLQIVDNLAACATDLKTEKA